MVWSFAHISLGISDRNNIKWREWRGTEGQIASPWQAKCKNKAATSLILLFYYYFGFQQDVVFSFLKYFPGI